MRNYEGGPIPFTAVLEYGELYGLSDDDIEDFREVIRRVNQWMTDYAQKKTPKTPPKKGGK